jgi:serine phosphatase RsbU (regulator of sigma subunit)
MFGIDRMLETLNAHRKAMPIELLTEVKNAVDAFAGEAEQSDDVTLLEITLI